MKLERRRSPSSAALLITVLLALFSVKCGDDNGCTPGVPCPCSQTVGCVYECEDPGCIPRCNNVDFCQVSCGDNCDFTCNNASRCGIACGGNCDVNCHDVSECRAVVGPGSSVDCTNLSNCEVHCQGDCNVRCQGVPDANCSVSCRSGSATSCGGGRVVCGRGC